MNKLFSLKFSGKILIATIAISALMVVGCHFTTETLPADAGSTCGSGPRALSSAEFNSWFESGAVSLNGVVKPANSVLFADQPNCSFYKWTEQMFLWLTSPSPSRYGGNGLVMNSPVFFDVSLPDADGNRTFLPHSPGLVRAFNLRTAQRGVLGLPIIVEKKTLRVLEVLPSIKAKSGNTLILDKDGKEREIEQLQQISKQTFYETFASTNSEENMNQYLTNELSLEKLRHELLDNNAAFYFALLENTPIGYLKINFGKAQTELQDAAALEIERIYVLKEYLGQHVGQQLYDYAITVALHKKLNYVWLGVWEENHRAIQFYKKNGFVEFDKHIFQLGDDAQTDIMMKLDLNILSYTPK